ncbi:hypothetical protein GCM10027076_11260 [Nocardioides montaniterrae]
MDSGATGPGPQGGPATRHAPLSATAAVARARAAAAKDHRPVLIDFGAGWCPDCVTLDGLYRRPGVARALQRFHLVEVDVGDFDQNLGLARKYVDLRSSGIPALVVLTPTGRIAYASNDGAFANARTMTAAQVTTFLGQWAHASS